MATLLETPGRLVSRERLLERVWGGESAVEWRTVDSTVGRVRRRLQRTLRAGDLIRTVPLRGYAFGGGRADGSPGGAADGIGGVGGRCWVVAANAEEWLDCSAALVQLGVEPARLAGDAAPLAVADPILVVADRHGGWRSRWQSLVAARPGTIGLLLPGSGNLRALRDAAAGGNLRLLMPGWWREDLLAWLTWLRQRSAVLCETARVGIDLLPEERAARLGGVTVSLAPKDFEVLTVLHRFAGRVVDRDQLRELVWRGSLRPDSRSLDLRISSLRRVIRRHVPNGTMTIETVTGIGYRLLV
jgi:DNA-binding response OmpR family regulator